MMMKYGKQFNNKINMINDKELLSEITVHNKYARHVEELNRRETWTELVTRNMEMHIAKYPKRAFEIKSIYNSYILTKKVLPSMRSLQFGGKAIDQNNARIYNCAFMPVDNILAFSEGMFLLLGGTGIGYSVQNFNVEKLPEIRKPNYKRNKRYIVHGSMRITASS